MGDDQYCHVAVMIGDDARKATGIVGERQEPFYDLRSRQFGRGGNGLLSPLERVAKGVSNPAWRPRSGKSANR